MEHRASWERTPNRETQDLKESRRPGPHLGGSLCRCNAQDVPRPAKLAVIMRRRSTKPHVAFFVANILSQSLGLHRPSGRYRSGATSPPLEPNEAANTRGVLFVLGCWSGYLAGLCRPMTGLEDRRLNGTDITVNL